MECEKCGQTPFGRMYVRHCPDCQTTLCAACFENSDHSCYKRPEPTKAPICVNCSKQMVVRHRKSDGKPFYGCKNFPNCRETAPVDEDEE